MRGKQRWRLWRVVIVLICAVIVWSTGAPIRAQDDGAPLWFVFQGDGASVSGAYPRVGPFRVQLNGEHFQNLNHTALDMYFQSWTPDGEGMIWASSSGNDDDLFWTPPDGWNEVPLTSTYDVEERFFCWTPDGDWMIIQERSGEQVRLAKMRPDGTDYQALVDLDTPRFARFVSWSPSGDWLLFLRYTEQNHKVPYRMRPDGTGLQSLQPHDDYYTNELITISPDQRYVITGGRFHPSLLFLIEPDAIPADVQHVQEHIHVLAEVPATAPYIAANWSPDGAWLLLGIREKLDDDPTYDEDDTFKVFRLRPDGSYFEGSEPTGHGTYWQELAAISAAFLADENAYWMPAWSPDSTWLVLADDVDEQTDLFRVSLDGTERVQLTASPDFDDVPAAVSPDGAWVLGIAQESFWTGGHLYRMRPDGSDWQSLLPVENTMRHEDRFSTFTPDGQGVILWHHFNAHTSRGYWDFFHVRLDDLTATQLTDLHAYSNIRYYSHAAFGFVGWYPPQP